MQFDETQLDEDFLLSRSDVEKHFGVPKRYLEVADLCGKGPRQVRLGRSVRYRVRDVRWWIEQCANEKTGSQGG